MIDEPLALYVRQMNSSSNFYESTASLAIDASGLMYVLCFQFTKLRNKSGAGITATFSRKAGAFVFRKAFRKELANP